MEYRRVESIRRQFRAVCRLWKVIVEDLDVGLTLCDLANTTVPSESHLSCATRIEFASTGKCTCMQCPSVFVKRASSSQQYEVILDRSPPFHSNFKPNKARVISLSIARREISGYLQHAPHLVAFGGEFSLLHNGKELQMQSVLERLTHLSIHTLSPRAMSVALSLSQLRFLNLGLFMSDNVFPEGSYIPLSKWRFPKLTSLVVDGVVAAEGKLHEELHQLFQNHSTLIENFIMKYGVVDYDQCLSPTIDVHQLGQYPHLKLLGLRFLDLDPEGGCRILEDTGAPPRRLSLLLSDSRKLITQSQKRLLRTSRRCIHLCSPPLSLFDEIVLLRSWNQLVRHWDTEPPEYWEGKIENFREARFSTVWVFFKELYQANIRVVDRDGVGLGEGDGLKLLERFKRSTQSER
ncbi:hypothetical protein FRC15_007617 [Serendipita sp. 397]|nr:hypothetical protein FRC15_007617 [Serendipita sp. 397]